MYIKPVIIRTIDIGGNKFFEIFIKNKKIPFFGNKKN
jgi:phosphoenolpyruvate-protein kinase (PTS system EI component)